MLRQGLPVETIMACSGLSRKEIEQWRETEITWLRYFPGNHSDGHPPVYERTPILMVTFPVK